MRDWIGLDSEEREILRGKLEGYAAEVRANRHQMTGPALALNNLVITLLDADELEVAYSVWLLGLIRAAGSEGKAMVLLSELAHREELDIDFTLEV